MSGTPSEKFSAFLERRSGWIVIGVVIATLLLIVPLIALAPDEHASTEPGGPIFDLRDLVDERFPRALYVSSYILESPDGPDSDVLTQAAFCGNYSRMRKPCVVQTSVESCGLPSWRTSPICTRATTQTLSAQSKASTPSLTPFKPSWSKWVRI